MMQLSWAFNSVFCDVEVLFSIVTVSILKKGQFARTKSNKLHKLTLIQFVISVSHRCDTRLSLCCGFCAAAACH